MPLCKSVPIQPSRLKRTLLLPTAIALVLAANGASAASSETGSSDDDQAKRLDTVTVIGSRIDDAEGGRVGTKMDVPLRETPQSVSVVTREQMEQRGARTVEEALRYSAGMSLPYGYDQRYDWVDVRGFQSIYGIYRDGLLQQGGTFAVPRFDTYALERVEVLKGPAGVMYGAGSPGGVINLVSKRPDPDAGNEMLASVGAYDSRKLGADLNGELGKGNGWLYRLVALASENDSEVDYNFTRKWLLMPSLRWQNDSTQLDLQATWQKVDSREGNSPTVAPYLRDLLAASGITLDIPRSRFLGEPGYDRFDPTYTTLGWTFQHRFNDRFTLRQNTRYNRTELAYRSHYLVSLDPLDPYEAIRANLDVDEASNGIVSDTSLEAKFGGERIKHTLLAGVDYRRAHNRENDGYGAGANLDLIDPVYGQPFTPPVQSLSKTQSRQLGFYLQDHIKFDERWVLLLGGRYDFTRSATQSAFGAARHEDEAFSGRAGLVYVGAGGFAPYLSYSESFQPVNDSNAAGEPFKPETGRQVELGARWQPFGSDVLISTAVFDLRKQNMVITDPNDPSVRRQLGEARSRGFEAEANTRIAERTQLTAALTWLDTETLQGDASQPTGAPLPRVPEQSASVYLDHTLASGALSGLNFGGGVRYVGHATVATTASLTTGERLEVETPSYALLDASVHYPWRDWTFSLTGSNLANREYSVSCNELVCYRGYGRRIDLTARLRW